MSFINRIFPIASMVLLAGFPAFLLADAKPTGVAPLRAPESYIENHRFLRTSVEVLTFNLLMTLSGRYVIRPGNPSYELSFERFKSNPINGFEWDDNTFFVNSFRHPYQGAQYFGAGRSNGYDFYQSAIWAFAGSWLFEYTGEANPPSYNDWIDTAVGGIALGETLFRLSGVVLDNSAWGFARAGHELGGLAILPMRGANRLFTGEMYEVHANPPDRRPGVLGARLRVGARMIGDEQISNPELATGFLGLDITYGDPFQQRVKKPFDAFTLGADVSFDNEPRALRRFEVDGVLAGAEVGRGERSRYVVGGLQSFDYINNEAYSLGAQSFGASFLSRFRLGRRFETKAALTASGIVLGATETVTTGMVKRRYDRGPGAAYALGIQILWNGRQLIELSHSGFWIHPVNGNVADHYLWYTHAKANFVLFDFLGVGGEYMLYTAESSYGEFPDTHVQTPEFRLFVSLNSDESL